MAPTKPKSKRDYRADCLGRLEALFKRDHLDEEFDPVPEVEITPSFKFIDGGVPTIIQALRAHDEDDARDFIAIYDELSAKDRKILKLEEIACAVPLSA